MLRDAETIWSTWGMGIALPVGIKVWVVTVEYLINKGI